MTRLYCVDKVGKIRVFESEVSLAGNATPGTAYLNTYTGILGGNLTKRQKTINSGKQKRSVNAQAQFEEDSLVKEKLDEGYKSLASLEARYKQQFGVYPSPSGTLAYHIVWLFRKLNIRYNTNSYWLPLPMLAAKWKDEAYKIKYPVLVQPKLNGVRCIALLDKADNVVKLLSRGGQIFVVPQITSRLLFIFNKHPDVILDGEIYIHGMPLQDIVGRVKVEDVTQLNRKDCLEYHIYDLAVENTKQAQRLDFLESITAFNNFGAIKEIQTILSINRDGAFDTYDTIKYVEFVVCANADAVKKEHDLYVSQGYEGAIIRDPEATYQFGFRDKALIKMKEFLDEEFEIAGCEVDTNKGIESFVFILENNQRGNKVPGMMQTFKARPTGTLEQKEVWYKDIAKYVGKKATIRFQERTIDGLPHQAHVRHKDTPVLLEAIRDYEN